MDSKTINPRRKFIGNLAAGAAALGMLSIPESIKAAPSLLDDPGSDADKWFDQLKSKKHKIMFDVTSPHKNPEEMMPFAWSRVFLMTNGMTGTPAKDCGVVMILRHAGIPYAFNDSMWTKYSFGEMFGVTDPFNGKQATKNDFAKPAQGAFSVPGFGVVPIGINELQADGVMVGVCNAAMTVFSAIAADKMKLDGKTVLAEWKANLLPGIQVLPSGVWAVGRAQEHGCGYCFAGA
jgi:intracellular sulfur oxidation DsrE/DsrF family protein